MKAVAWVNSSMSEPTEHQPTPVSDSAEIDAGTPEGETAGAPAPAEGMNLLSREFILGALAFVVFITLITLLLNAVGVERLQATIEEAGPLAPLAYIVLKALTYIFAPLTSGPIQVFAGALFDNIWLGVLYTLIGETIGGSISFLIARHFGRPVVARIVGAKGMQQVDTFSERYLSSWVSLSLARLLLFSFWDFLSYGAGLVNIRFTSYVLVSFIVGAIPTALFVALGSTLVDNPSALLPLYVALGVVIVASVLLRKPILRLLDRGKSAQPDA